MGPKMSPKWIPKRSSNGSQMVPQEDPIKGPQMDPDCIICSDMAWAQGPKGPGPALGAEGSTRRLDAAEPAALREAALARWREIRSGRGERG